MIMKSKKYLILIIGIFILLSCSYASSADDNMNKTTLIVSSEGPVNLSDVIEDIQAYDYYGGYSNDTLKWMQSLGQKSVYTHTDKIVIMNREDADKLPSLYICDASMDVYFSCNVISKKSLGNSKDPLDVYYVANVEYQKNETHYYEV